MNTVFTIVAKNYLSLAFVQGKTLKAHNPETDYYILLADEPDELDFKLLPFNVDTLDVLALDDIEQLSFKYNLTEFCTAVKPFYIEFLFNKGYEKVLFLDPDICCFSSIQTIFDELSTKSIVVTPHFITPEIKYTGTITEQLLLHVGVFNLGFIGVSNTEVGKHFISWWRERLHKLAYQDKIEALHTDQKWIDLVPVFYGSELLISYDIGRNMAFWNLHERKLINNKSHSYQVENKFTGNLTPLMLFHFAGYDIENYSKYIHKHFISYNLNQFPELKPLFTWYKNELLENEYEKYIKLKYSYNNYINGSPITNFQRRLFRKLIESGLIFTNPFNCEKDSFYELLKESKLLSVKSIDSIKNKDVDSFQSKILLLNFFMKKIKAILGFDKYSLLLKFCMRYYRPENQTFLFKNKQYNFSFKNENQN